jgi:ubiquinone/menaquinone biosynthesis C-methylase UbiE
VDIFNKISPLQEEMSRLQTQAEEFGGFVAGALQKLGLTSGMSAADIGCGTGHVTFELSRLIGPRGLAAGLDANPTAIEFCKKAAEERGVKNTRFVIGDAQKIDFESCMFDAVFSRFLLQHVKDPGRTLKEMIRIAKPGGTVMIEDCDLQCWTVEPEDKHVKQLWTWYESIIRQKGSDPAIGRKLYSMFVQTGLKPQVEIYSLPVVWENRKIWDSIVGVLRKVNRGSDNEIIKGIEDFKQKKEALFVFPLVFRVWAKTP